MRKEEIKLNPLTLDNDLTARINHSIQQLLNGIKTYANPNACDGQNLPIEIWFMVMANLSTKDIAALSGTSCYFYNTIHGSDNIFHRQLKPLSDSWWLRSQIKNEYSAPIHKLFFNMRPTPNTLPTLRTLPADPYQDGERGFVLRNYFR